MRTILRWCLLPFALMLTVLLGIILYFYFENTFLLPEYTFSVIAILWIIESYLISPSKKMLVTTMTLIFGITISVWLTAPVFYPEYHPKAYEVTYLPFITIISSGIFTQLILVFIRKLKTHEGRTN
ncbi:MAG: hypothetical protein PQJ58_07760 [Spirochaetales bacterium]|nr:hypothetical protein [Spirochaetales bacterium]